MLARFPRWWSLVADVVVPPAALGGLMASSPAVGRGALNAGIGAQRRAGVPVSAVRLEVLVAELAAAGYDLHPALVREEFSVEGVYDGARVVIGGSAFASLAELALESLNSKVG